MSHNMNLWALGFSEEMSNDTSIKDAVRFIMRKVECSDNLRELMSPKSGAKRSVGPLCDTFCDIFVTFFVEISFVMTQNGTQIEQLVISRTMNC